MDLFHVYYICDTEKTSLPDSKSNRIANFFVGTVEGMITSAVRKRFKRSAFVPWTPAMMYNIIYSNLCVLYFYCYCIRETRRLDVRGH